MKWLLLITLALVMSSCTITQKVKTGQMAYDLKQYVVAVELLEKEYHQADNSTEKGRKAFLLGRSHEYLQDYSMAIKWYEGARKRDPKVAPQLASAYKKNEQYEQAAALYATLCQETSDRRWCSEANLCRQAMQVSADHDVEMRTVSSNSGQSEYSPVFFGPEFLVFSSDRAESIGEDVYNWTGEAFSDLYVMNLKSKRVNNFDAIINTADNEAAACFSKDLNEIYFTRCSAIGKRDKHCRIYFSQRPNGFWMEPEPLHFFDEETNFGQPCLIENDSVLIFSANRRGTPDSDLYYSERIDGGWTPPEAMPDRFNTEGNESFPTSYGDTLYFASDGLAGYGGYDIFSAYVDTDGRWTNPENIGRPINSGADDFGLAIDVNASAREDILLQGYLSSNRNMGTRDDLFMFTQFATEEDEIAEQEKEEETPSSSQKDSKVYVAIRVVELIHEQGDPSRPVIDKQPLDAADLSLSTTDESLSLQTKANGFILQEIANEGQWSVSAAKSGYFSNRLSFAVPAPGTLRADTTINVELPLEKLVYDKEIVLNDIFYDYNKWDIRDDAKPPLDRLVAMMELNPSLRMELASHTDCRGEEDYNLTLSTKRAASAKDYLISKGIEASRLSSRGYGESVLVERCRCQNCTEDQHQKNRRTTFKILK